MTRQNTARTEDQLSELLSNLLKATKKNSNARKAAVRWFNRLYYDFKRWSDATFESIRSHRGLLENASKADLKDLKAHLQELMHSLYYEARERRFFGRSRRPRLQRHQLQSEFCDNLEFLAARFERDFDWLAEEDPEAYVQLEQLIGMAQQFPGASLRVYEVMFASLQQVVGSAADYEDKELDRGELLALLDKHEKDSRKALQGLHEVAREARIALLDVNEYQSVLANEGSSNPEVMVIGEVTMSQDKIHIENVVGPVNVKARLERVTQIVKNAPAVPDKDSNQLASLIEQLKQSLEAVAEKQPEDSQRVAQAAEMVAAEVSKQKPSKSFLAISAEGLKEAAKAVEGIAPNVLSVATQIAQFISQLN